MQRFAMRYDHPYIIISPSGCYKVYRNGQIEQSCALFNEWIRWLNTCKDLEISAEQAYEMVPCNLIELNMLVTEDGWDIDENI